MKRTITFIFALSVILYLSNGTTLAQSKGGGQGHGPAVTGTAPHTESQANKGGAADHDKTHATKESKETGKDNFENRIEHNAALKTKVESMLPAGMDLKTAAGGFKNQGQFIAALHVSKNLGIPFTDLKSKMTGSNPESLGQAIHDLKPPCPRRTRRRKLRRLKNRLEPRRRQQNRSAKKTGTTRSTKSTARRLQTN